MSDVWGNYRGAEVGVVPLGRSGPVQQAAHNQRYTDSLRQMATNESILRGLVRPPVARRGVVMLTIGCQTVLAWIEESPVQRIDAGPVGIRLHGNFGTTLLSIDEMGDLRSALSGLIEEAKLKEHEIRSKLAGEDLP